MNIQMNRLKISDCTYIIPLARCAGVAALALACLAASSSLGTHRLRNTAADTRSNAPPAAPRIKARQGTCSPPHHAVLSGPPPSRDNK